MSLDKRILELRSSLYKRKNTFIKCCLKHFHKECKCEKKNKICNLEGILDLGKLGNKEYVREIYDNGILESIYNIILSVTQTMRNESGKQFEKCIETVFKEENIDYDSQVLITNNGKIIKSSSEKGHIVDFLVPKPEKYPMKLEDYKGEIVSCKTLLRERYLQDKFFGKITLISLEKIQDEQINSIKVSDEGEFTKWILGLRKKQSKLELNNLKIIKKMNVLDLFCGCGGMTKGLVDSGLNVIAGIDYWQPAINTYSKNNNHLAICEDLKEFSPRKFEKKYLREHSSGTKVDIIVGGPPCQGFSIAGKREMNDPRNSLFMEYVKYLDYFQPKAFIFENVMGILSMRCDEGKCIDVIMSYLEKDYNCKICKLYASDFGVPQNRRRVIIFGIHKSLNIFPTEPEIITKIRPPVSDVLLPREEVDSSYFLSKKAIEGIRKRKEKMKSEGKGFGAQFLDLDKPSYTISSRYYKDGYDALVKYSETDIRRLTELELARIQSFPDDYIFEGNKRDLTIQIGNAVACKFAFYLGEHLKKMLKGNSNVPEEIDFSSNTVEELKEICREKGIKGYSKLKKQEIVELIKLN